MDVTQDNMQRRQRQHASSVVNATSDQGLTWESLRAMSLKPGGFGEDRVRIWPALLGVQPLSDPPPYSEVASNILDETVHGGVGQREMDPHPDEHQIRLDTDRSFVLYPEETVTSSREAMQTELHELVVSLFRKHRSLHYFQGCHDILSVLFLTLPPPLHLACAEKMSLHRVRDSMGAGLEPVVGLLRILRNLLRLVDPEYAELLESVSPLPYHALPHLLTLFAHDVPTLALIQHVWDFLLTREPLAVVWLVAALVVHRKPAVYLLAERDEEGMIHSLLTGLPELVDSEPDTVLEVRSGSLHDEGETESESGIIARERAEAEVCVEANSSLDPLVHSEHDGEACLAPDTDQPTETVDDANPSTTGGTHGVSSPTGNTLIVPNTTDKDTQQNCFPDALSGSSQSISISQDTYSSSSLGAPSYRLAHDSSSELQVTHAGTSTLCPCTPPSRSDSPDSAALQPSPPLSPRDSSSCTSRTLSPHSTPSSTASASLSSSPHKRSPSKYRNAPLSLPHLLHQTDALLAAYPPSHPSLRVRQIMGPDSVVWTWREPNITQKTIETPERIPYEQTDDYLESLVNSPHIVLPTPPPSPPRSPPLPDRKLRPLWSHKRLLGPRRVRFYFGALTPAERRILFAGALLVVGAAIALKVGKIPRVGEVNNGKGDIDQGLNRLWPGRWWSLMSSVVSVWGRGLP